MSADLTDARAGVLAGKPGAAYRIEQSIAAAEAPACAQVCARACA